MAERVAEQQQPEREEPAGAWSTESRASGEVITESGPAATSGRGADRPTRFRWPAWRQVLLRTWNGISDDHISIIAAGVAFFGMVATVPSIAALISILGFFADPVAVADMLDRVRPVLPADAHSLIEGQVDRLISTDSSSLGLASLIALGLALWSSRAGVQALMEGLNIVYRETDTRNIIRQYLSSFFLTIIVLAMAVVALIVVVALPAVLAFLQLDALGALGNWLARVLPLLILGLAVVFVIGALYRMGPHRAPARKRWITPGAVISTLAWVLASYLLSTYISRFANFNQTYGSLGAIVAMLFWLYVTAFVVLLGAKLNAEMELQTEHDTTTGPPRPLGERGAYVADHVS